MQPPLFSSLNRDAIPCWVSRKAAIDIDYPDIPNVEYIYSPVFTQADTSESGSLSIREVSPYFQRPATAMQIAKPKEGPDDPDASSNKIRQRLLDEKCARCFLDKERCDGTYPFFGPCSRCRLWRVRCNPQGNPPKKGLISKRPIEERCYYCAQNQRDCDGEDHFQKKCSVCKQEGFRCFAQGQEPPKYKTRKKEGLKQLDHELEIEDNLLEKDQQKKG